MADPSQQFEDPLRAIAPDPADVIGGRKVPHPAEALSGKEEDEEEEITGRTLDKSTNPGPSASQAAETILNALAGAPANAMPLPENSSSRLARRRSVARQQARRGRMSTILTAQDTLGG